MNDKSFKLNKINSISLQKITKKYYRMNTAKTCSLSKIIKNNDLLTINSTTSTNNNIFNSSKNMGGTIVNQKKAINPKFLKSKIGKKKIRVIEPYQIIKNINYKKNTINTNNEINKRISSCKDNNWKKEEKLEKYAHIDIDDLYKSKDKKVVNVERFNDAFRIEMNNTFYKYDPKKNLKYLNNMQRDNIELRKDMEIIKQNADEKIQRFCHNKKIKKHNKLREIKYRNTNVISARNLPSLPEKIPFNIKFQSQKRLFPYGYKIRALYEHQAHSLEAEKCKDKIFKGKNLKEKNNKNSFINREDLMDKTLKKLYVSLDTRNIAKYINDVKKEKVNKDEEITEYRKKKYFPFFNEIKEYMKKYEMNKNKNKDNNKEDIEIQMLDLENKLLKNINDNKKKMIDNIDDLFVK